MTKDYSDDERDLLHSDDTGSVNSLLKASTESGESIAGNRQYINYSVFEEKNRRFAKVCVMITVVLERAAYYGLVGNLAYFANLYLNYDPSKSIMVTLVFSGMTWLSCFIGGIFGDSIFGRFKTILFGLICYVCGYVSLTWLGHKSEEFPEKPPADIKPYTAWFVLSLLFISLGEGLFKANMSPFGADQVDETQQKEMRTFFNYFYWAINAGSFIGFSLIAWVQQEYNFCTGYIIPCSLLGLAILFFVIPRKRNYHVIIPTNNAIKIVKIFFYAMKKKR